MAQKTSSGSVDALQAVHNGQLNIAADEQHKYDDGYHRYDDGRDDGYETDVDEMDGYEPECYEIAPYEPPPAPWYSGRLAMLALAAVGVAVVAIVVSASILVSRQSRSPAQVVHPPTSVAPTPPMTTAAQSPVPPPDTPAPATPPPTTPPPGATTANTVQVPQPQPPPPSPQKGPQLNVTRTPLSVSPPRPTR